MNSLGNKKNDRQLTERLATSGFRFTSQRRHVYDVLLQRLDHGRRIGLTGSQEVREGRDKSKAGTRTTKRLQDGDMPSDRWIGRRGHMVILARPLRFGKNAVCTLLPRFAPIA